MTATSLPVVPTSKGSDISLLKSAEEANRQEEKHSGSKIRHFY